LGSCGAHDVPQPLWGPNTLPTSRASCLTLSCGCLPCTCACNV
jgi:hypothetical protein